MIFKEKIKPKPGQESVWDYPRPPRLEKITDSIQIIFNCETIADSSKAYRVLETSHPPVYYLPPDDIRSEFLKKASGSSFCEWKGLANYYSIEVKGKLAEKAAWYYPNPTIEFAEIKNHLAFYPALMDACLVNGEKARPQPGDFYGGWITDNIVGPFKGEPGTLFW